MLEPPRPSYGDVLPGAPPKPRHGEGCNQCGRCCAVELCPLGVKVFKRPAFFGRCPALLVPTPDHKAPWVAVCGLVAFPRQYAPTRAAMVGAGRLRDAALLLTGAGRGCDACDACADGEERDLAFSESLAATVDRERQRYDEAMWLWGIRR